MQDETKDFWNDLEEEIGEKVIWYSLGELLQPFDNLSKNTVGMFFLTESSLFFQTFPRNDLLRLLSNSFRKKKKGGDRIQQEYPLNDLESAEMERPKGLFQRLSSGKMPVLSLQFSEDAVQRGSATMRFTLIDKNSGNELIERLNTGEKGGSGS